MAYKFRVGQWVKLAVAQPSGQVVQQVAIFMPERQPVLDPVTGTLVLDDKGEPVFRIIETVHLVDANGETSQVVPSAGLSLEAVTDVLDIPAPRRAHLPKTYNPALRH